MCVCVCVCVIIGMIVTTVQSLYLTAGNSRDGNLPTPTLVSQFCLSLSYNLWP